MRRLLVVLLLVMVACSSLPEEQEVPQETPDEGPSCPDSCNDNNKCTEDTCSALTNYQCAHMKITPCCGNSECESGETSKDCPEDCKAVESKTLNTLLDNQKRIKSYRYSTNEDTDLGIITVMLPNIRIEYASMKKLDGQQYDTAILNTDDRKVSLFCRGSSCTDRTLVFEGDYDDFSITTPFEQISDIGAVAEENIRTGKCEGRDCTELDVVFGNIKGRVKIEEYYGFPYMVKKGSKTIEYSNVAFNSVKDSDFELP